MPDRIPDNLKNTIGWLLVKWVHASERGLHEDRWSTFDDFCLDVQELVCVSDDTLTEDAKDLKREILSL